MKYFLLLAGRGWKESAASNKILPLSFRKRLVGTVSNANDHIFTLSCWKRLVGKYS